MKRIFTLLLAVLCLQFSANAQLADGSVVPNFTVTDLDGNQHELYDILDQGYSVVIDVFATWCGPCWSYHQTHALEDVWNTYGPNGTDEIFVMGIEADGQTTANDMIGTGGNTLGDWTEGITYPMIDDGSMAQVLGIAYYPTIYHICSNRTIVEAGQLSNIAAFQDLSLDCPDPVGANNAGILLYDGYEGDICGDGELEYAPSITLQNTGLEAMTAATIELSVNGTVEQSIAWTGMLTTFQLEEVAFEAMTLSGGSDININIADVNGMADEMESDNSKAVNIAVARQVYGADFTVEVQTDEYGDETYWAFVDASGNIVADGGNPQVGLTNYNTGMFPAPADDAAYAAGSSITVEVVLPEGCYNFIVTDYYGDGMCCNYGDGYVKVTNSASEEIINVGDFGAISDNLFESLWAVSANDVVIANNLNVFPNPVSDQLNVEFDLQESAQLNIDVYNALGQMVKSVKAANYTAGNHLLPINTSDLSAGMYMVTIRSNEGSMSEKFTVTK